MTLYCSVCGLERQGNLTRQSPKCDTYLCTGTLEELDDALRVLRNFFPDPNPIKTPNAHRWGWLIRLVGVENFRKIGALPPDLRASTIKTLAREVMRRNSADLLSEVRVENMLEEDRLQQETGCP